MSGSLNLQVDFKKLLVSEIHLKYLYVVVQVVSVSWYTHKEIQTKNFKVELYLVDMHKEIIHRDLHFCSQLSSSALLKDFPFALQSLG